MEIKFHTRALLSLFALILATFVTVLMASRQSALQAFPLAWPVAQILSLVFFLVKGIFPVSQQVVERLLTQTPHRLMNPKDPRGMLKALPGSRGTQVSSLVCLRALFQLFLMYSGAQTAQPTWPTWNHSILSSLPTEPQQQILPWKVIASDHRHCRRCRFLCSLLLYWFCFIVIGISSIGVEPKLNGWGCSFDKNTSGSPQKNERHRFPSRAPCSQPHPAKCRLL